eukprot:scaffold4855_cov195-Amphora_coffeaeformis.AAC.14
MNGTLLLSGTRVFNLPRGRPPQETQSPTHQTCLVFVFDEESFISSLTISSRQARATTNIMQITHPVTVALVALFEAVRHHAGGLIGPLQIDRKGIDATIESVNERIMKSPVYGLVNGLVRQHSNNYCLPTGHRFGVSQDSTTNVVTLRMELPGVSADDLDVSLENETLLRIQSEHQRRVDGKIGGLNHFFQLEEDVDPASLQVALEQGILEVVASKKAKRVQTLKVKSDSTCDALASIGVTSNNQLLQG